MTEDKQLDELSIDAIADLLSEVQTGHCSCRAAARIIYTASKRDKLIALAAANPTNLERIIQLGDKYP